MDHEHEDNFNVKIRLDTLAGLLNANKSIINVSILKFSLVTLYVPVAIQKSTRRTDKPHTHSPKLISFEYASPSANQESMCHNATPTCKLV